jgi:transcriptional regulator NrdR family protein
MTTLEKPESLQDQIAHVKQRLADTQARIPQHDVPAAVIAEMDELEEELERLQALASGRGLSADDIELKIAQVEQQLADVRARVPKHTIPAALIAEIDELDEELERLRSLRDAS